MAPTPHGQGYWLAAADGGVFTYGDAGFYHSLVGTPLNKPVVGIAGTPDGRGYWLAAGDGGVFPFGDAYFEGSAGNIKLNAPVVGVAARPDAQGYWLAAGDGGVFQFNARFYGSAGGSPPSSPVVGISATPDGRSYALVTAAGQVLQYRAHPSPGPPSAPGKPQPVAIITPAPRAIRGHVHARLVIGWIWRGDHTRVYRIQVRRLPRGGSVTLRCRGRGCPRRALEARPRRRRRLFGSLYGHVFRAGDRLVFTIRAPGLISERVELRIRKGAS